MTDPLRVLGGPDSPVPPDPEFADRLRVRLSRALDLPEGIAVSITENVRTVPRPGALPYLNVGDARAAIRWYVTTFGAVLDGDPIVMDDNRIGHSELLMGGGTIYLADAFPEMGLTAPVPGAISVSLMLEVDDTDAVLARSLAEGATLQNEAADRYGSRTATILDPFGHRWMLSGPSAE
jgi:uncharacterized glyoxalase superfamily protein PhnB